MGTEFSLQRRTFTSRRIFGRMCFKQCLRIQKGPSLHLIGAIDQGTQSTRFVLYDKELNVVAEAQNPHEQFYPNPGWCEHDAEEIWKSTLKCISEAIDKTAGKNIVIDAIGITNQRETTVAWNKTTGKPLAKALVWLDTRTTGIVDQICNKYSGPMSFHSKTGLPVNTYFSAAKMKWLYDNVPAVAKASKDGTLCLGTIDAWLMWKLTNGASFVTDITNAQRTFLVDVNTCQWSTEMCKVFGISMAALPSIKSCSETFGICTATELHSDIQRVPITGCAGDQQAACIGQALFKNGQVKCTFGTGAFILRNVGTKCVLSTHGLLATPCYQLGKDAPVVWALEGSIPIAGAGVSWLKDNLKILKSAKDTSEILQRTKDTGGVYMVPAFSGLFAPRWRTDARGIICGVTQATTKDHIIRALLESIGFQMKEVFAAMAADAATQAAGTATSVSKVVRVDGGMSQNDDFLQLASDLCAAPIERPQNVEVTAIGAAVAAGLATGFWASTDEVEKLVNHEYQLKPKASPASVETRYKRWKMAVDRSLGWENSSK
eukprot:Filipodium_phascolosomae@DN7330_c0_g1_i1.p1